MWLDWSLCVLRPAVWMESWCPAAWLESPEIVSKPKSLDRGKHLICIWFEFSEYVHGQETKTSKIRKICFLCLQSRHRRKSVRKYHSKEDWWENLILLYWLHVTSWTELLCSPQIDTTTVKATINVRTFRYNLTALANCILWYLWPFTLLTFHEFAPCTGALANLNTTLYKAFSAKNTIKKTFVKYFMWI